MRRYHPRLAPTGRHPRPASFRLRAAVVLGGLALFVTACGPDGDDGEQGTGLDPETEAACQEYSDITNQWGREYGTEMGAVGEARADGDDEREEEAIDTVRELFLTTAEALYEQADTVSDEELAAALEQSAAGAEEIAADIGTYDDVEAAPEMMSEGDFAAGGELIQQMCAGEVDVPIAPVPTS